MSDFHWHTLEIGQIFAKLTSEADGLTTAESQRRIAEYGPNQLPEVQRRSLPAMVFSQFADFMIIVLLAAALISGFIGEPQDTIAILVIVVLNAVIGAVQEFRAERAVAALKAMAAPEARALRDGQPVTLSSSEIVPGDVVFLEAGDVVPADLRLFEVDDAQVDESSLTGESYAVEKQAEALTDTELSIGDRNNLAYKSSLITHGNARGVVVATGSDTEIGRIASLLRTAASVKTPLQIRLGRFGRYLALAVIAICMVVFTAGLLQGQPVMLMFLTAVSLAVAAIPEALPAVVTIALAFGARKLVRFNALVRNLPAVETLGSVTYICTDKTGTLTENRMSVEQIYCAGETLDSLPSPGSDAPGIYQSLGVAMALNNDVMVVDGQPAGEPTELALFAAAREYGFDKSILERKYPRLAVIPFASERMRMTTLHQAEQGVIALVKGAPEQVLSQCETSLGAGHEDSFQRDEILAEAERLAAEGYRIIAYAQRELSTLPGQLHAEEVEQGLCFIGLVALIDPPRAEVPQAVSDCLSAGITPVMITGDHAGTAMAIARRLGFSTSERELLSGDELATLDDEDLSRRVEKVRVYARVSPEQKLRIVKALQENGEFVAMTGDGVNDAPALKTAGIGVAMGQKGTDVAREASDMVLLDDDFATIVRAVRAGRRIFDNIRKFIKDTMSSNSGEIWTLFLAPFLGLPIPLMPIHILWINLVTDGLPGLAFTAEPAEPGIMNRPPRPPEESIFAHGMWQHIVWVGLFVAGITIATQAWALVRGVEYWQTMVFTVLTISQLFHSLAVRSETASLLRIGLFSNLPMLGAVLLTVLLHMAVIYMPVMNEIFHTQPLPWQDLLICITLSSLVLFAVEIEKWFVRRRMIYADTLAM